MRTHRDFLQPTSFDEEEQWEKEREQWSKRDLSDKEYVYLWADGSTSMSGSMTTAHVFS